MSPHLAWYTARAAGYVAWLLLSASVLWGLTFSSKLVGNRPRPRWVLDLHRFLAGLAVAFTLIHVGALIADTYVPFSLTDVLVPFAASWHTGAVALGVVSLWLLLAVEATSLMMAKLPRRLWHGIHLTSYALFWSATLHGLLAGTDAHNPAYVLTVNAVVALVVFASLYRALAPRAKPRRAGRRSPAGLERGPEAHGNEAQSTGDLGASPAPLKAITR